MSDNINLFNSLLRNISSIENNLALLLATIGRICARHPYKTLAIYIICCMVLMTGFLFAEIESVSTKLWVDQNSIHKTNQAIVDESFESTSRYNDLIITSINDNVDPDSTDLDGNDYNVITQNALAELFDLHQKIMEIEVDDGKTYNDLCIHFGGNDAFPCFIRGVLNFWNADIDTFNSAISNDDDAQTALAAENYPAPLYFEVDRNSVMPGYVEENNKAKSRSFVIGYLLKIDEDSYSESILFDWETKFVEVVLAQDYQYLSVAPQAERSVDDALGAAVDGDITLMITAFILMICVGAFTLGIPFGKLEGRTIIGNFGVVMVVFAGGAAYGICMFAGIPFTTLAQVLPFLLIGIGIDDAFVIVAALDKTSRKNSIEDRMYETLYKSGVSVTITSLTDVIAFFLGSLTVLPAVQYFCFYAAISILFIYIAHITAYIALLTLDERRRESGRQDCLLFLKVPLSRMDNTNDNDSNVSDLETQAKNNTITVEKTKESKEIEDKKSMANLNNNNDNISWDYSKTTPKPTVIDYVGKFLNNYYAPFLMKTPVKIAVIIFFFALASISGWTITKLSSAFELADLAPDDHYVRDNILNGKVLYGASFPPMDVGVYFGEYDYTLEDTQFYIQETINRVLESESIDTDKGATNWLTEFTTWAGNNGYTLSPKGFVVGDDFYTALNIYLLTGEGSIYASNINFSNDDKDKIILSRIYVTHILLPTTETQITAIEKPNEACAEVALESNGILDPVPFVYHGAYQFFHQYSIIIPEAIQNLSLCLAAVAVICSIALVHPLAVLILVFSLGLTFVDLLASLVMWDLDINSISVVNLVMSLALVVDGQAHFIKAFTLQNSKLYPTRNKRVLLAFEDIGPSVFLGGLTTFLGVVPLGFSTSHVFRVFFKMFLSIVILSMAHALVFIPVLLSIFGPSLPVLEDTNVVGKDEKNNEKTKNNTQVAVKADV